MRTSANAFFALALAGSWGFWGLAVLAGGDDPLRSPLYWLGGAAPPLAAIWLTHRHEPVAVRWEFWRRLVDVRRIGPRWLAVSLLAHPLLVALAVGIDVALGGTAPPLPALAAPGDAGGGLVGAVRGALGLAVFVLLFGPLPEEIGWRGFALPRLLARTTAWRASLSIGVVWGLWHLPLFFVPGTFQAGLGVGTPRFAIFMAALLPLSVLMTWVFVHTRASTLSAVLMHFSGNLAGALVAKTTRVACLELALLSIAALALRVRHGPSLAATVRREDAARP